MNTCTQHTKSWKRRRDLMRDTITYSQSASLRHQLCDFGQFCLACVSLLWPSVKELFVSPNRAGHRWSSGACMLYRDFMVGIRVFFVLRSCVTVFSYPHDNKKGIAIELLGSLDFAFGLWRLDADQQVSPECCHVSLSSESVCPQAHRPF